MSESRQEMHVRTSEAGGKRVVQVSGEVDLRSSPQLRERMLHEARQASGDLIVDLSGVPYIDSSGVGTIVFVKREVERSGAKVILAGLQPRVRSVFEITNLEKFFKIVDSVEEAAAL